MMKVLDRLSILNTRAFRQATTIAVVGNGGISEEDNEIIEASDCVVRFNNYATRKDIEYTKDKFRCDVLFSTFDLHSNGADPGSVVIGIPFPFHQKEVARKIQKWYPRSAPYCLNPYINAELCGEIGLDSEGHKHPIPSIGFTAVWHIHRLMAFMRNWNPNIHVAGFNWYSDKDKLTIQNRRITLPKAGHFNHHYREEMAWMINNIMLNDQWSFSGECFDILQAFQPYLKK